MYCTKKTKWQKVSRQHRCPICGKPDWCLFAGPPHNPDTAICARVESPKIVGTKGAGWLHRLRDDDGWRDRPRQQRMRVEVEAAPPIDFAKMVSECYAAMGPHMRGYVAADLGVNEKALELMYVGWSAHHSATTWVMHDGRGEICGIRLRRGDGSKFSVRGSRNGIFVGHGPDLFGGDHAIPGTLVVVEGATDTAAMLSLGIESVGRPSCSGGVEAIIEFCSPGIWDRVAIFADADEPGQRGARSLAARLVGYVPDGVRIVTPPAKDVREWVRAGAAVDDVRAAIDAAPIMQLRYGVKGGAL